MTWPPHPPAAALLALSLVALLLVVAGVSYAGFKRGERRAHDALLAEQVLTAIYGGSFHPVDRDLEPGIRSTPRSDVVVRAAAMSLKAKFGLAQSVARTAVVRQRSVQKYDFWTSDWRVGTAKGGFDLRLNYNSLGVVTGVWLRVDPGASWATVQNYGMECARAQEATGGTHG
jgi:hypothetical protein